MSKETESEEINRQPDPKQESRLPVENEQKPSYYRRELEREGWSEWSGGSWGGRTR